MTAANGDFSLYGVDFRWFDSTAEKRQDRGVISLFQTPGELPSDGIDWLKRGDAWAPWFGRIRDNYVYRFEDTADVLLPREGNTIRVFVRPQCQPWAVNFVLTRGVIPRLLHLKGIPCLHSSAVSGGDGVVGFLGSSGCGKSTIAAALVARGFRLVSDDVLPLRPAPEGDGVVAGPGLAELRLTRPAAKATGLAEEWRPPEPGQTKGCWTPRPDQVVNDPVPLKGLYLLRPHGRSPEWDAEAESLPVNSGAEALLILISQSFWLHAHEIAALASDILCFSQAVRSLPVRRLRFQLTPSGLAAAERLIREETLGVP